MANNVTHRDTQTSYLDDIVTIGLHRAGLFQRIADRLTMIEANMTEMANMMEMMMSVPLNVTVELYATESVGPAHHNGVQASGGNP